MDFVLFKQLICLHKNSSMPNIILHLKKLLKNYAKMKKNFLKNHLL